MAMRMRVARQVVRGSGARRNTAAQKRTVRTRASEEPRRAAPSTLDMLLTTLVAIVAIIGGTAAIINPSIEKLTISNNASINAVNKELTATTASIKELKSDVNTKLDALSANVQAEQVQTSELQGQVTILREGWKKK